MSDLNKPVNKAVNKTLNLINLSALTLEKTETFSCSWAMDTVRYTEKQTIVFIPSLNLTILKIHFPLVKQAPSSQALLYAVENQLLEDIEQLGLTVLSVDKKQQTYFAVIYAKKYLSDCFEYLKESAYLPAAALPDIFALPYEKSPQIIWQIYFAPHAVIVRTGRFEGFSIEPDNFYLYMQQALAKSEAEKNKPAIFRVFSAEENLIEKIDFSVFSMISVEKQDKNISLLALACRQIKLNPSSIHMPVNLLKENLENTSFSHKRLFKKWFWPIILLSGWLMMLTTAGLWQYAYLNYQQNQLDKKIAKIYFQLYPASKEVSAPKARMQQDMNKTSAHAENFWPELLKIGSILNTQKAIRIKNIAYENNPNIHQFQITFEMPDFDAAENLNALLKSAGFSVSAVNALSDNKQVLETLSVRLK